MKIAFLGVGQNHVYVRYKNFLAGKSQNIQSYTVLYTVLADLTNFHFLFYPAGCGSCGSRVRKVRRKKVRVKRKPGINDGCPDDESPSQRYDVRSHETQQGRRKGQRGVDKGAGEENISVSGELGHITI